MDAPPKPKLLLWDGFTGALSVVMLALADLKLWGLEGNASTIYNISLGILVVYCSAVIRFAGDLQKYSIAAAEEITTLSSRSESLQSRLNSYTEIVPGFQDTSRQVEIKGIKKGRDQMVLLLEKHHLIAIDSVVALVDEDSTPIGNFKVDAERSSHWLATSMPGIDAVWLGKMLSEDRPELPAHAFAYLKP
ncbi:hypothetical protein [Deinococcus wulumuqiensis]|uniref:hypothetical protein n=1 Tax=Deinococcus wulumuqiensis TaxID=980427 RepID=UPI00178C8EAD|nr:hypothetical protein [Deinococcus wulumuqiensis]